MMNNILSLIHEKKEHLIGYETFSYQLLNSEIDELNQILDQREEIIQSISQIDCLLHTLIEESELKPQLYECKNRDIKRCDVSVQLLDIYDGYDSIYDSLNKIQNLELKVIERLDHLKNELNTNLVQVENVSKIKKYFETYETEMQDMTQMMRKTTKI